MEANRYRARISELVEPAERLLAVAVTGVAHGVPPELPKAEATVTTGRVSVAAVLLAVVQPSVVFEAGDRFVDLVCWGVAGRGPVGSAASRLHQANGPGRSDGRLREAVLAVTDRRLLFCLGGPVSILARREDEERSLAGTRIVWSVPRTEVASARVGWHRLNPKRLRIDFTDGSWTAFTVPIAEPGQHLRAVATALSD